MGSSFLYACILVLYIILCWGCKIIQKVEKSSSYTAYRFDIASFKMRQTKKNYSRSLGFLLGILNRIHCFKGKTRGGKFSFRIQIFLHFFFLRFNSRSKSRLFRLMFFRFIVSSCIQMQG